MKINRKNLRQIIKEELTRLREVDTSLTRSDAEYAYDNLGVRLSDEKGKVLDKEGTVKSLMADPDGLDDLKKQIKQLLTKGHLTVNDIAKSFAKKLGLDAD